MTETTRKSREERDLGPPVEHAWWGEMPFPEKKVCQEVPSPDELKELRKMQVNRPRNPCVVCKAILDGRL